ncbi:hypothetical protein [Allosphingosinicella sp.]|uniref:hypothetical protein n=1 Tax=Allosphingosinicella sp. TaxID=2823234 RepID=UPI002FC0F3E9
MNLRALILTAAILLSSHAAAAEHAPAGGSLEFVDLTDDFAKEWERTASMEDAVRVATFKAYFDALMPGFYAHERLNHATPERLDKRLLKAFQAYPEHRVGIEEVSGRFSDMITPALASFEAEFGPMRRYPPVYLVHSLGEFDGGTRSLLNGNFLLFGADVIARLHLDHDIQPFFHHELFHFYHARSFPECGTVWCGLWTEGLAAYVASELNPGATDAELLLTQPEPIRAAVDANRREAVCETLARLDSTQDADMQALFSFERLNETLPPRFGYYVGYLVAAEAGKTRSLQQLATLGHDEVRPLVEARLRGLETCPA